MHDGRFEKLDDAVRFMARYQLGKTLSAEETAALTAFLHTLTGTLVTAEK
jgi:cytochrome c peroxidase